MKISLLIHGLLFCSCLAITPSILYSQSPTSGFSTTAPVGVVDNGTLAAGKIKLSAIDLSALNQQLSLLGPGRAIPENAIGMAKSFQQTMLDAGVDDVYLSVATKAIPQGGLCVVIPCREPQVVATMLSGIVTSLPPMLPYQLIEHPDRVIVCPKSMATYFQDGTPANLARFDNVLDRVEDVPHQLAFGLPDSMRTDIVATLPKEMSNAGHLFSPSRLAESVSSGVIAWDLPPKLAFELRLQCADATSALAAAEEVMSLLAMVPEEFPGAKPQTDGNVVTFGLDEQTLQAWIPKVLGVVATDVQQIESSNNMKSTGLAMHNFHDVNQFIPGKATVDAEGKRLLSWRVSILPYLGQVELYEKFKIDEPWDSPTNKALIPLMPEVYSIPGDALPAGMTRIRMPIVAGGLWEGEGEPRTFANITDGTSNTIWFVEAPMSAAIQWTRPDDWVLDESNLNKSLFGGADSINAAFVDGSIRPLSSTIDSEVLKALLTMAGGEVVDSDSFR
jgi:hypothetical protein